VVYVAVMSLSRHAYFQIWIDNDPATDAGFIGAKVSL
jgi:hypothetical protein